MNNMELQRLGNFGIEVKGVNLQVTLDPQTVAQIVGLLYDNAVVCLRDQSISPAQLAEFGARLGTPTEHNEVDLHLDGLASVMSLSNADNRDDRQLNGGAHWHTDLVHTEEPASFTMLHAVAVPPSGGGTLFANQIAAYEAMPQAQREQIDDLVVVHCYEGRTDDSYPRVRHRLVQTHRASGKTLLYGAADTGIGIVGYSDEQAMQIYQQVGEFATRPEFIYRHQYRLHDVVIWDNSQLLHAAEVLQRASSPDQHRIMHRVSVRGWPQV